MTLNIYTVRIVSKNEQQMTTGGLALEPHKRTTTAMLNWIWIYWTTKGL